MELVLVDRHDSALHSRGSVSALFIETAKSPVA